MDQELIGRLDERFKSLKEHIDFRFNEQDKKNIIIFDFINNKIALKEDLKNHIENHWKWLGIFGTAFTIFVGLIEFVKDRIK